MVSSGLWVCCSGLFLPVTSVCRHSSYGSKMPRAVTPNPMSLPCQSKKAGPFFQAALPSSCLSSGSRVGGGHARESVTSCSEGLWACARLHPWAPGPGGGALLQSTGLTWLRCGGCNIQAEPGGRALARPQGGVLRPGAPAHAGPLLH